MKFFVFSVDFKNNVVYKDHPMKHRCKEFDAQIDEATNLNFRIVDKGNKVVLYPPDPSFPIYTGLENKKGRK